MSAKEIAEIYLYTTKSHEKKGIDIDKVLVKNLRTLSKAYLELEAKQEGRVLVPRFMYDTLIDYFLKMSQSPAIGMAGKQRAEQLLSNLQSND